MVGDLVPSRQSELPWARIENVANWKEAGSTHAESRSYVRLFVALSGKSYGWTILELIDGHEV